MGHFSIWLENYKNCRDRILEEMKSYKKNIQSLRNLIEGENLILPLAEDPVPKEGKMGFVDGGEGVRDLLGASVYFIKSSALILDKNESRYEGENFIRDVDMGLMDYNDYTKERIELLRSSMEFDAAIKAIEEYLPDYLFLDGSLYVCSRQRPIESEEYELYRKKFNRLLKKARRKNIHIVGVSEDSKSKMFANHLCSRYEVKMPRFMTDSSVLKILSPHDRYRTVKFTPHIGFETNPKTNSGSTSFPTSYVQPTIFSSPLRVDVPSWEQDFDSVIELVADLCKGSNHFGYPLPLYLVHLDAKVERKHADWSMKQIVNHLSREDPELMDSILQKTRRDSRPLG